MTGILLSGGKNTRMGSNKAFLRIGGERLIDRCIRVFRPLFTEIILVTNEPLLYLDQDVTIVTDLAKNKGPLMGIYTGLSYASSDDIFVAACDMPFLNGDFIRYMIDQKGDEDILAPLPGDRPEPLHAVYSKRCMGPIRSLLETDRLKITGFYSGLREKLIGDEILRSFDPHGRMFSNVNRPEDLILNSSR